MSHSPSATRAVVDFVERMRFASLPREVVRAAKRHILDSLAVTLGGVSNDATRITHAIVEAQGGATDAHAIGTTWRGPVPSVALVNGVAGHVLDYDDTQLATHKEAVYGLLTHPSVPCLAAALPFAEARHRSGRELIAAFAVGTEVECRLADASFPRHYYEGFHSSGTFGHFASVVATAMLAGLRGDALARAIGLAAAQAAGLREHFGTMAKSFHVGKAASNGVLATLFAERGFTAAPDILEAPRGFYQASSGGFYDQKLVPRLGNPWFYIDPGVSIKPHPSGSLTHPAMTLLARLVADNGIRADQVALINVGTNKYMPNALKHPRPTTELEAKFSMQFCLAILLIEGRAGIAHFTDDATRRADVRALIEKIDFSVDDELESRGYDQMWTRLDLHLLDGRTISGETRVGRGHPDDPMSDEELAAKCHECAGSLLSPGAIDRTVDLVFGLEHEADVRRLVAAFTPGDPAAPATVGQRPGGQ
ncbi:MAG: MmgE/PrpD family protein [Vicinamibacterales bacterium]